MHWPSLVWPCLVNALVMHWPGIAKVGRSSLAWGRQFKLFTGWFLLWSQHHSSELVLPEPVRALGIVQGVPCSCFCSHNCIDLLYIIGQKLVIIMVTLLSHYMISIMCSRNLLNNSMVTFVFLYLKPYLNHWLYQYFGYYIQPPIYLITNCRFLSL